MQCGHLSDIDVHCRRRLGIGDWRAATRRNPFDLLRNDQSTLAQLRQTNIEAGFCRDGVSTHEQILV